MARALHLAAQARGTCSPNPAVGGVLVRDGGVVGEGFTQPAGSAHAEIVALEQAGELARGAVLYVSLEPCCHQGRTAPCVEAIVRSGVAEVRMAMIDPSPWVNGRGRAMLDEAGLKTSLGDRADEARRMNEAYFKWVTTGLPHVTAIYALTFDGRGLLPSASGDLLDAAALAEYRRLQAETDRTWAEGQSVPEVAQGQSWADAFGCLGRSDVTSLLFEAQPGTVAELWNEGLVDRVVVLLSTSWQGQPIHGAARDGIAWEYERIGGNVMAVGERSRCSPVS